MKFCKLHLKCCEDTKIGNLRQKVADFTYYFFTIHSSLNLGSKFLGSNRE